ncbi:MAG: NEW3 domain-containing protein [Candidatus Micrarchaeota archaeon]
MALGYRRKGLLILLLLLLPFSQNAAAVDEWYNNTWHYRLKLDINATNYDRVEWVVERDLNFTDLLRQLNFSGTSFDNNSVRVFEYNSSGGIKWEVPSQFDVLPGYNAYGNALGTLVFSLNGTTAANTSRLFYVYFDETYYGFKVAPNYPLTAINFSVSGTEITINNTAWEFGIDTARGENSSGLFRVISRVPPVFNTLFDNDPTDVTSEYTQLSDGAHNLTFNFTGNLQIVQGPVRLSVILSGNETYWNDPLNFTNIGQMIKRYRFYQNSPWVKIYLNYTASTPVNRSSLDGGAVGFDIGAPFPRGFGPLYQYFGNSTDPFSWIQAQPPGASYEVGMVHLNESGSDNFSVINSPAYKRLGVNLNWTTIPAETSIVDETITKFDAFQGDSTAFQLFMASWQYRENVTETAERWNVTIVANTSHAHYNRNETVVVYATVVSDAYGLASSINASIDNATPADASDDYALSLYDDGTHGDAAAGDRVFTNNFTLPASANISAPWTVNATAWDASALYLGFDTHQFNVTDVLAVNTTVLNAVAIAGFTVNASLYVRNFRKDTALAGAAVSCNYTPTATYDFNNGTYIVSFTAPLQYGSYAVLCNATLLGNFGEGEGNFTVESAKTNMTVSVSPGLYNASNITQAQNESYVLFVYSNNSGNGTAVTANITLQLPAGWSANSTIFSCGNVSVGGSCDAAFLVTIPNATASGNYSINASAEWGNPDGTGSSNLTTANVSVLTNPIMNVTESFLFSYVAAGVEKAFGAFNVSSLGNDPLQNVSFEVTGLGTFYITFSPPNFSTLAAGSSEAVAINVTAPAGHPTGNFTGTLNVSTANAGYSNITLVIGVSGTNLTIAIYPGTHLTTNITQSQNNTFVLEANTSNPGNMTGFNVNLTLSLPANFSANSTLFECGTLNLTENCSARFLLTVLEATRPGNFTVNVTIEWVDPETGAAGNTTPLYVNVTSNPVLTVVPANISANATHGNTTTIANFSVSSTGNDDALGLTYALSAYPNFVVVLQGNVSSLAPNENTTVLINVSVPLYNDPGSTPGSLCVNSSNAPAHNMSLEINVSADRSWTMAPTYCERMESPDTGSVCEVFVNNTGNTYINFTIDPQSANHSSLNVSALNLSKFGNYRLLVSYDVSGFPKINYTANFTFNVTDAGGTPASRILAILLYPFGSLPVSILVTPNQTAQLGSVTVYGNVTDSNLVGMANMTLIVTDPAGNVSTNNMTLIASNGTYFQYSSTFPNLTGSIVHRGNYTVTIIATDSILVEGNATSSFTTYAVLVVTLDTFADTYYMTDSGVTASIYYRVREAANTTLYPVNVSLSVVSPSNLTLLRQNYTVGPSGVIENPVPSVNIPPDQPIGNYTMTSFSEYYDGNASLVVNDTSSSEFEVLPSQQGNVTFTGLLADVSAGDIWTAGQTPRVVVSVFDVNGTPVDPDSLNITVLAPNDTVFANYSLENFTRHGAGAYSLELFPITANTTSGVFLVVMAASKAEYTARRLTYFRVAASVLADVQTTVVWYPQSVMQFDIVVRASDGMPLDPDSLNLTVYDPANAIYLQANISSMTKQSPGFYIYRYAMPLNTATGAYLAYINTSVQGMVTQAIHPFRVAAGGPYDVRLELLENEVPQGDYLDFRIIVSNMGEVTQDVGLEYWVEDLGGNSWYYATEAVLVARGQEVQLLRSAFIYTSQPPAQYKLKLKMTYDLVQAPIYANASFLVTPPGAPTATPAASAPPTGGQIIPINATPSPPSAATSIASPTAGVNVTQLTIVSTPDEIVAESGDTKYIRIDARNDGLTALHNLTLLLSGVPLTWLEIRPSRINALSSGGIGNFVVKLNIPKSEKTGVRVIRAMVTADEAQDERSFNLVIFESRAALVEYELQRTEERLRKLAKDAKEADAVGKDVTQVLALIEEATSYKNLARDQLRREQLDDALSSLKMASVSIAKATTLLAQAKFRGQPYAGIPWYYLAVIVFVAAAAGFLLYFLYRKRRHKKDQPSLAAPAPPPKPLDQKDVNDLQAEKEKILRVMRLLEDELHQGVISQNAYRELRKRNERQLESIQKRLKDAG